MNKTNLPLSVEKVPALDSKDFLLELDLTNEDAQWDAGTFMQFIKQTLTDKPDIKDPKSVDCIKEYCVKLISHLSLSIA